MELLGMLLVLVLVLLGSEAQNQVDVNVTLGQDVTLTCSYNVGDIHWFMEDQNQSRIRIGQIFSLKKSIHDSPDFKTKYLMIRNQLVIQNFSAEDSRRYFCGEKRDDFSGGTFILIPAAAPSSSPSPSASSTALATVTPTVTPGVTWLQENAVLLTSFSLNVVLLVAVLCFTAACIRRNGCSCSCRAEESAENIVENQEMQIPQYEEIQLPRASSECIYSKAWYPASMDPHY